MNPNMKNFFYPATVCIPGASSKEKSVGYELLKSIKNYGFNGKVYPINPKAENILGYKCYAKITDVKDSIDLAVVVVPKIYAEDTIDELLSCGVRSIILITAGFKEAGNEGAETEKRILGKIKLSGASLVGPNCMGVISTLGNVKLNATFVAEKPETGSTAFLSQSGAIGAAILNSLRESDIRFAHFISVGNKADVSENDILGFWTEDDNIKTITMYLESFVNGEEFLLSMDKLKISKPVIILKAGRTKAGIKAASSHTGALGSSDKVVDSLLRQFGVIRAETLTELFNTSKGFENFPYPSGNKIAIVTNAGGPAILAVDSLEQNNLILAGLAESTKEKLRAIVHPDGSVQNPIDLLPLGTAEQYKAVIGFLINDENVDAVISIFVEPVMVQPFNIVESVNAVDSAKPVLQVVMPLPEFWDDYRKKSHYKKPLFRNPEEPVKVISNILLHKNKIIRKGILKPDLINENIYEGKGIIPQKDVLKITGAYNIPMIESELCAAHELDAAADKIGFPVVLKGISKDVIHKTDLNAVFINIKTAAELNNAKAAILQNFSEHNFTVDEFLIQRYVNAKHEILLGGFRDASFGPVIMFGSGGKYVEVTDDISMKSAYLCDEDIDDMIDKTKIGKILRGVRGEKPADLKAIKNLIKSAAQLLLDNTKITEFDFNPVIVSEENSLHAVDIRIKLS